MSPLSWHLLHGDREIHPLDPQPHRHSMLVPRVCAPRVTRCRLGKYWWRVFFRKRLRVVDSELAIQSLISFRCIYLGQIGCQGYGLSRQPILGVHMLSMTHREAAIFDDACTVPTPCLLLPDGNHHFLKYKIFATRTLGITVWSFLNLLIIYVSCIWQDGNRVNKEISRNLVWLKHSLMTDLWISPELRTWQLKSNRYPALQCKITGDTSKTISVYYLTRLQSCLHHYHP